jgi:hypothetical protein
LPVLLVAMVGGKYGWLAESLTLRILGAVEMVGASEARLKRIWARA